MLIIVLAMLVFGCITLLEKGCEREGINIERDGLKSVFERIWEGTNKGG